MNRVDEHRDTGVLPDPRGAIEALRGRREQARARLGRGEVELYRRTVATLSIELAGPAIRCRQGIDEGTALRWFVDGGVAFAAATGGDEATIEDLVAHARRVALAPARFPPPAEHAELSDLDRLDPLPRPGELRDEARRRAAAGREVHGLRLEVARSLETCVGPAAAACRTRERVAATAQLAGRARRAAARGWAAFRALDWVPGAENMPKKGASPVRGRWIVAGEAAAILAGSLALRLHGPDAVSQDVGRGWVVHDDPAAAGSLLGGTFDDTCRPSPREELADGNRTVPSTGGAGRMRRPSFRDPPVFMRTGLTIASSGDTVPEARGTIDDVAIHPLDRERWLLVLAGQDSTGGPFRDATLETGPRRLARACMAAPGPAGSYWNGVRTPSLLLEL